MLDAGLLCLALKHGSCQRCRIDRHIRDFLEKAGQSRHDIIMTMGDENTSDSVLVLLQIGKIRYDHLHAVLLPIRIFQSAFQNKNIIVVFHNVHILAVFIQTA